MKELVTPSVAVFEVIIVCMSEGKPINVIVEILKLIKDIALRYRIEVLDFGIDQFVIGLGIYRDLNRGFFDSLVAGSALAHDRLIIGDDDAFLSIPNLSRKRLAEYLRELKGR